MKILICDYIICDRPFSHMGQEYLFLWLSEIFVSACLSHPWIKLLSQTVHHIDAQELLLQHMFLGCNCIYKHFVETKKQSVENFRTFIVFFFFFFLS